MLTKKLVICKKIAKNQKLKSKVVFIVLIISQMPGYLQKGIKFCTIFANISNRKPTQTFTIVKQNCDKF